MYSLLVWKRKEGNVLFNDALNTFLICLYGIGLTVKDHSYSERGNPLPPLHGLLFQISRKWSFICTTPQTGYHIPWSLLHQSWSTGWNEIHLTKYIFCSRYYSSTRTVTVTISQRSYASDILVPRNHGDSLDCTPQWRHRTHPRTGSDTSVHSDDQTGCGDSLLKQEARKCFI